MRYLEEGIQRGVIQAIHAAGVSNLWWFAVPNGGWRLPTEASIMRSLGVRAGVHDLVFCIPPTGRLAGLELKGPKGRVSPAQANAHDDLIAAGGLSDRAFSIEEAIEILTEWGALRRDRIRMK